MSEQLIMYYKTSCSSSRRAKKWLTQQNLVFSEKPVGDMSYEEFVDIVKYLEYGLDHLLSSRTEKAKLFYDSHENLTLKEVYEKVMGDISLLRSPILIQGKKVKLGYQEEDIRVFIPRKQRRLQAKLNARLTPHPTVLEALADIDVEPFDEKKSEIEMGNIFMFKTFEEVHRFCRGYMDAGIVMARHENLKKLSKENRVTTKMIQDWSGKVNIAGTLVASVVANINAAKGVPSKNIRLAEYYFENMTFEEALAMEEDLRKNVVDIVDSEIDTVKYPECIKIIDRLHNPRSLRWNLDVMVDKIAETIGIKELPGSVANIEVAKTVDIDRPTSEVGNELAVTHSESRKDNVYGIDLKFYVATILEKNPERFVEIFQAVDDDKFFEVWKIIIEEDLEKSKEIFVSLPIEKITLILKNHSQQN